MLLPPRARALLATLAALAALPACSRPATGPAARRAVSEAYLAWWSARRGAYRTLDPATLRAYATTAALGPDEQRMASLRADGHVLRLAVDHSTQILVYRNGTTASVDDVYADHSVELDATTLSPIQADPGITVEESTTLHRAGGRWIVDAVHRFGVSEALPGQQVSWAAVAGGKALPDSYTRPILSAYLAGVAAPDGAGAEHNDRVAIEQDSVAWVYDTYSSGRAARWATTRLTQSPSGGWSVSPSGGP